MEPDPIGLEGGLNVYNYAAGNPVNNGDPSGLQWLPDGTYVPDYRPQDYTAINNTALNIPNISQNIAYYIPHQG